MCFSATGSFISAGILGVIGLVAVRKSRGHAQIPFAVIPFLFCLQQVCEGVLWVELTEPSSPRLYSLSSYIFLVGAQVMWPIWVPLSIGLLERIRSRRDVLTALLFVGVALGSYLLYSLVKYDVGAELVDGHIHYFSLFPTVSYGLTSTVYTIVIILPLFVSSVKWVSWLGVLTGVSFAVTSVFYFNQLVSVWCFFATAASLAVLLIIAEMNRTLPAMVIIYRKPSMPNLLLW